MEIWLINSDMDIYWWRQVFGQVEPILTFPQKWNKMQIKLLCYVQHDWHAVNLLPSRFNVKAVRLTSLIFSIIASFASLFTRFLYLIFSLFFPFIC